MQKKLQSCFLPSQQEVPPRHPLIRRVVELAPAGFLESLKERARSVTLHLRAWNVTLLPAITTIQTESFNKRTSRSLTIINDIGTLFWHFSRQSTSEDFSLNAIFNPTNKC